MRIRAAADDACAAGVSARLEDAETGAAVDAECVLDGDGGDFACVVVAPEPGIYAITARAAGAAASAPVEVRVRGAFGARRAAFVRWPASLLGDIFVRIGRDRSP